MSALFRTDMLSSQHSKQEHYCRKPREVLRALEDLASKEREMYA